MQKYRTQPFGFSPSQEQRKGWISSTVKCCPCGRFVQEGKSLLLFSSLLPIHLLNQSRSYSKHAGWPQAETAQTSAPFIDSQGLIYMSSWSPVWVMVLAEGTFTCPEVSQQSSIPDFLEHSDFLQGSYLWCLAIHLHLVFQVIVSVKLAPDN